MALNIIPGRPGAQNNLNMKKLLYILSALLILAGCGKDKDGKMSLEEKLCGEWHSTSLSVSGDVYLDFSDDKTFGMYQKIGSGAYRLYRGTWNLENGLLTGKYNDGEGWSAAYNVEIKDRNLTLTSNNDAAESTLYTRCEIPAEVKDGCEVVVKSCEGGL